MKENTGSSHFGWAAGAVVLGSLAWQGHHLSHLLPQFERMIENLGPWAPLVFCTSILVLQPFLVPDTLFALAASAAFGLVEGTAYYFAAVYVMCLAVQWLGSHWLKARVLRLLETRRKLRTIMREAPKGGVRFMFLVRLLPVNQALLSYVLGAAGVPLRAAFAGNLGMFPHVFPTVYFGAATVHMTRMAGKSHKEWEIEGVLLMLGLGICVALTLQITRRAWAAIGTGPRREPAGPPRQAS